MRLVLDQAETEEALTQGAPIPPDYTIVAVDFQKYSADFCTLTLSRIDADRPLVGSAAQESSAPVEPTPLFQVAEEAA